MARHQFVNTFKQCRIISCLTKGEKFRQSAMVHNGRYKATCQNRLNFGRKQKMAIMQRVVEWFDAQAISRREQTCFSPVPQGERKHTAKLVQATFGKLLVCVDYGFCVTSRFVSISAALKLLAQLVVVINLAIVSNPVIAEIVRHGLMATL